MSDLNTRRGSIVVLTAPSGSGKTTIARRVLEAVPEMRFSVSATTRPPRPNERDGIDYHFMSVDEFRRRVRKGDLLEYEEVYPDRFYGTLRSEVETATPEKPVMLDVDVDHVAAVGHDLEVVRLARIDVDHVDLAERRRVEIAVGRVDRERGDRAGPHDASPPN